LSAFVGSPIRKNAIMIATLEVSLAQLLVRHVEEQLKSRLQRRAKRHGRSMEAEVREILRDALKKEEEAPARRLGSEIVALFSGSGLGLEEPIPELRGYPVKPAEFDE
jgi:plasmid stability protein